MFHIQLFNNISEKGLSLLPPNTFSCAEQKTNPDAILVRSHDLHSMPIGNGLKAVARAGAGINNIPVDSLTELGIPVFNTPGANANAVKELVIASMLIACRELFSAVEKTRILHAQDALQTYEKIKKEFRGFELPGKTVGIIGLGAIGVEVANALSNLGMQVIGYDPQITIARAWQLSSEVRQAKNQAEVLEQADFLSLHVPYHQNTHHLINQASLQQLKPGAIVLNFSRGLIIDQTAMLDALSKKQVRSYVCDFPSPELMGHPNCLCFPHLGASTIESEENCAIMACNLLKNFLETGQIQYSVNFPNIDMPFKKGHRIAIANRNVPNMLGQISSTLAKEKHNIIDMINKSREQIAFTLIDTEHPIGDRLIKALSGIDGVLTIRKLN